MLSKVAQRIYWLARYLERTESTARLILVRHHSVLDLPKEIQPEWSHLLQVLGSQQQFSNLPGKANERNVIRFVFGERDNPSSIISCVASARENMRTTREVLPSETWERVNSLYLSVARRSTKELPRSVRHKVLNSIIQSCQQITGMLAGTMSHDAAYQFVRLGRNLERADMSSRIIDSGNASIPSQRDELAPYRNVLWISVLQSLSAYQMYRQNVQRKVSSSEVIDFLLHSRVFPRAIEHTIQEIDQAMQLLPNNQIAVQCVTRLKNELKDGRGNTPTGDTLQSYIDQLQLRFMEVDQAIHDSWFSPTIEN